MTRRIAHVSDLHFGRTEPRIVAGLEESLRAARPDLVIVSGDLTQRARHGEFAAARAFLDRLPAPALAVPGNHDLPSWNLLERFVDPYARYRHYISPELEPAWCDEELGILGIKSSRRLTRELHWAIGRIGRRQLERSLARLDRMPDHLVRIVVVHHPLLLPETPGTKLPMHAFTGGAAQALAAFAAHRVQLVLSGHLHRSYARRHETLPPGPPAVALPTAEPLTVRHRTAPLPEGPLVVHAATATSTRLREEPNSYNLITIADGRITVEVHAWDGRELFAAAQPLATAAA
ncbi:MAG: metallophosphoesterase [Geminicoccaceae bacterium]